MKIQKIVFCFLCFFMAFGISHLGAMKKSGKQIVQEMNKEELAYWAKSIKLSLIKHGAFEGFITEPKLVKIMEDFFENTEILPTFYKKAIVEYRLDPLGLSNDERVIEGVLLDFESLEDNQGNLSRDSEENEKL